MNTHFLPATKAIASGIEDILVVTRKRMIEDHFDSNVALEQNLAAKHKDDLLKLVEETTDINLHFIYQKCQKSLGDAVMKVPHEETSKYGIINPNGEVCKGLYDLKNFLEKPNPKEAPSDLAIIGRYLLKPEIFEILAKQKPGAGNEIQLPMQSMN